MNETNMNNTETVETTENNATALTLAKIKTTDLTDQFATLEAGEGDTIRSSTTYDDVTLFNAVNGSAEKVEDYIDQCVEITDIVVTSADISDDINDPDAENCDKHNKPVVHFFTKDGKHISSISNGISRAAKNLLSCGFIPTTEQPFTIKFKQIKTKRGMAHSFDLIKK